LVSSSVRFTEHALISAGIAVYALSITTIKSSVFKLNVVCLSVMYKRTIAMTCSYVMLWQRILPVLINIRCIDFDRKIAAKSPLPRHSAALSDLAKLGLTFNNSWYLWFLSLLLAFERLPTDIIWKIHDILGFYCMLCVTNSQMHSSFVPYVTVSTLIWEALTKDKCLDNQSVDKYSASFPCIPIYTIFEAVCKAF